MHLQIYMTEGRLAVDVLWCSDVCWNIIYCSMCANVWTRWHECCWHIGTGVMFEH